jgi:hypothetical protein
LYFGDRLGHLLICPNQLRAHGLIVDDTPKQLDPESQHAIVVKGSDAVKIDLELDGVISYFESTKPTAE